MIKLIELNINNDDVILQFELNSNEKSIELTTKRHWTNAIYRHNSHDKPETRMPVQRGEMINEWKEEARKNDNDKIKKISCQKAPLGGGALLWLVDAWHVPANGVAPLRYVTIVKPRPLLWA